MPIDYNIVAIVIGDKLVSKTEVESLKPEQIKTVHTISNNDELKKLQTKFNTSKEYFMIIELK